MLFLWTASSAVSLGDGPETIAGARSFGVLHAPGYVVYAWLGGLVDVLAPGSTSSAIVGLSICCTLVACAAVFYLVARDTGDSIASVVAVAGLATTASVWFNATFAKHSAFTMTLIAVALWGAHTATRRGAHSRALFVVAVALGASTGAGWWAMATAVPAILVMVWPVARIAPVIRVVSWLAVLGMTVAVVIGGLVVRAAGEPEVNWGEASTPARTLSLLTMEDFRGTSLTPGAAASESSERAVDVGLGGAPVNVVRYGIVVVRDVGPALAALAAWGLIVGLRRRSRTAAAMAVLATVNISALAVAVGIRPRGFESGLIQGGYLSPTLLAVVILAGIGAASAIALGRRLATTATRGVKARADATALPIALLVAVTVPSLITHRIPATPTTAPFAVTYASDVFAELPPDSVLIVWGAERSFPLREQQVVEDVRDDVTIVIGEMLNTAWYREQLSREKGLELPAESADVERTTIEFARAIAGGRSVYLDTRATAVLAAELRHQPVGLTALVLPDQTTPNTVDLPRLVRRLDTLQGVGLAATDAARRWPNREVMGSYGLAYVRAANAAGQQGQLVEQRHLLETAARLDPDNVDITRALQVLDGQR
jgi:hypothetical protein